MTPQVQAFDDATLVENLASLASLVSMEETTRSFAPAPRLRHLLANVTSWRHPVVAPLELELGPHEIVQFDLDEQNAP